MTALEWALPISDPSQFACAGLPVRCARCGGRLLADALEALRAGPPWLCAADGDPAACMKTVRRREAQQHMLAVHMPAAALDLGRSKQNIGTTLSNPAGLTLTDCCDWLPPDAIFCRMELKSKLSPMVCSNFSCYTLCEFPRVDAIHLLMRTKLCGLKAVSVGNLGRGITADLCTFRYACTKATIAQLQDVLGTR